MTDVTDTLLILHQIRREICVSVAMCKLFTDVAETLRHRAEAALHVTELYGSDRATHFLFRCGYILPATQLSAEMFLQ